MSSFNLPYISKDTRELADKRKVCKHITPFTAMTNVVEICKTHFLTNKPEDLGFAFSAKYSTNDNESDILLLPNYDWKAKAVQKRPAVFIGRGNAVVKPNLTIGQTIAVNVPESEDSRVNLIDMPITVSVIATNLGFVEEFAEYVKYPFMYFAREIEHEYGFARFRLINITKPSFFTVDSQDSIVVELNIDTEFYDVWTVKGDHLKLKTVANTVFIEPEQKPLEKQ